MENVKIKQIKGADPEKKKAFLGGRGERDRKRRESKERRSSTLFVAIPLFPDSGTSLLTLAPQVEGDCGKRIPGSLVLFSRGKLWYRAHTQSL